MRNLFHNLAVLFMALILITGFANAADAIPDPVGYWPLDDNANDESSNGNNGMLEGDPVWVNGRIGQAIELNGTDQYVDVPGFNMVTDTATFVAWINGWKANEDMWTFTGIVFSRSSDPDATGIHFGNNDTIHYTWNDNADTTWGWDGGPQIPKNEWVMVAVTIEPSKATVYVYTDANGMQSAVNEIPHVEETVDALQFGHDPTVAISPRHFKGMIDEVGIYNLALSEEDIRALATSAGAVVAPFGRLATSWGAIKL